MSRAKLVRLLLHLALFYAHMWLPMSQKVKGQAVLSVNQRSNWMIFCHGIYPGYLHTPPVNHDRPIGHPCSKRTFLVSSRSKTITGKTTYKAVACQTAEIVFRPTDYILAAFPEGLLNEG